MPRRQAASELGLMVESLRHEPFYTTGTWTNESMGLYVGWAARKGSFADGMPLVNERGDRVLIFAGEEFPEPGTKDRLRSQGHEVESEGPGYLVHLAEEDAQFPAGLNGRFHGVLADVARGVVTLFNDRYGLGRLHIHQTKDAFYFAAEAKAILKVRPELRRLNPQSLGEFVSCGCVLEDRTLFENIYALPPASAWRFQNASIAAKRAYFNPREWEEQAPLGLEAWYEELRATFARKLPLYFEGGERIGMSLTGGLDGRMVMAWRKPEPGSLPCYTFGGTFRDCHDVKLARKVARACRQDHRIIRVDDGFLSRFGFYAERTVYLSDGCVEANRAPALYCNTQARSIAPVRMTGNYGSEVLRPASAFKPVQPAPGLFGPEIMRQADAAKETYARIIQTHPVSFSAFRQAPWFHYGLLTLEQTQMAQRSPYLDNDLMRVIYRAPRQALENGDACLRLIADGDSKLRAIPTDRGLGGRRGRAWGSIVRGVLEFSFKSEYAYDYGMPQWVARIDHAAEPLHLERLFLGRHKFYHFRVWYRDQLSAYLRETLLDPRSLSRPYLEKGALQRIVEGHLREGRNYTQEIHKALTLELLHRLFIDSSNTAEDYAESLSASVNA